MRTVTAIALAAAAALTLSSVSLAAEPRAVPTGGFAFEIEVVVPGTPEQTWDAFTGETLSWWDHTFSGGPKALYIDTKPGGGFYEIFDDAGNGAMHARVTYADRAEKLRMVGPLGLADHAIELVCTLTFTPKDATTKVALSVHAAGEVHEGWPKVVESVWRHFLVERFVPYMQAKSAAAAPPPAS